MPMFRRHTLGVLTVVALTSFSTAYSQTRDAFGALKENAEWTPADGALTHGDAPSTDALETRLHHADGVLSFEFRAPPGASATMFIQGRYAVPLAGTGNWQPVSLRFRAPRFDAGYNKQENALALEVRVGAEVRRNVLFAKADPGARWDSEDMRGPTLINVEHGPFAIRGFQFAVADFAQLTPPKASGGATNEKDLKDLVALGKETFESVGCSACHLVVPSDTAVSSGPNLFGLFRPDARPREVVEGGEGHRFTIKANRDYLQRSVRAPADQLAVAEGGPTRGQAYLPVMPAFAKEVLTDQQIDAIGDYLATLNAPGERGPAVKLSAMAAGKPYDPMADGLQWLVGDTVRLQRGPIAGVSGRSIHVGNPNGVHYTFDPRLLAIVKIWQGGFLDMTGELTNRGGRGLALGFDSRETGFGGREYLLAPLDAGGKPIDFTFKDAKFGDFDTLKTLLASSQDQLAQVRAVDAQFLGYSRDSRDKLAPPAFRYRVGRNDIEITTRIADDGAITIDVSGALQSAQVFTLNPILQRAAAGGGKLAGDRWTIPAGTRRATLTARIALAATAWRPPAPPTYSRAPLQKEPAAAKLPAGYTIESWYPPKDNYGRNQLFEALGLAVAKDGTVVVGTRTAGIWRIVNGQWRPFAEGLFDSLGVVVEDGKGLVVVAGQKAELTRISDTNGDGIADRYDTLFDAHSYHGNYHTYMHGPVRAKDGSYYFALNLAHDGTNSTYNAGGAYMGTWGGFSGWAIRVEPSGKFAPFAYGLRSPASLGVSPDGRLWYADNQGEYVGTSKMFELQRDKYYGHPAGLVDLPGMTPASPEIQWEKWMDRREREVILFPHNRVANSPGNPAWVTQAKFGPFAGQMLIGDQTQSNLLRVVLQKVDGVEQGSVMPFFEGLESGVMRPVFLADGSLLLGQTGRGWQAKGGKVASLQHVRWDGKTVAPAIVAMTATPTGFRLDFTQSLGNGVSPSLLKSALTLQSWTYRDAPDYGSPELDVHSEEAALRIAADRRSIFIDLASLDQPKVHPRQTARVYFAALASATLFDADAPRELTAYYTLKRFPTR